MSTGETCAVNFKLISWKKKKLRKTWKETKNDVHLSTCQLLKNLLASGMNEKF